MVKAPRCDCTFANVPNAFSFFQISLPKYTCSFGNTALYKPKRCDSVALRFNFIKKTKSVFQFGLKKYASGSRNTSLPKKKNVQILRATLKFHKPIFDRLRDPERIPAATERFLRTHHAISSSYTTISKSHLNIHKIL